MPKLTPEELEAKAAAWQAHVDRLFAARDADAAASFAAHQEANESKREAEPKAPPNRLERVKATVARQAAATELGRFG